MRWTIWQIKAVVPDPSKKIQDLAELLDKKEGIYRLWKSQDWQAVLKALQTDSTIILNSLLAFESLSFDDIRGLLAKFRANNTLLSTLKGTKNIDEIQSMLDEAVKLEAVRR